MQNIAWNNASSTASMVAPVTRLEQSPEMQEFFFGGDANDDSSVGVWPESRPLNKGYVP